MLTPSERVAVVGNAACREDALGGDAEREGGEAEREGRDAEVVATCIARTGLGALVGVGREGEAGGERKVDALGAISRADGRLAGAW